MRRHSLNIFLLGFFLFVLAGIANGGPIFVGDTDELVSEGITFQPHQDSLTNVNWLVNDYNIDNDPDLPYPLTLLGKWEVDENAWEGGKDPGFTGDFTGNAGTWSAPTVWNPSDPIYYSFKAGNQNSGAGFELFYANGDTSGTWNTSGLEGKDLSHLSFWTVNSQPVPEPATMLLFGTGLVGLVGSRLRKKNK